MPNLLTREIAQQRVIDLRYDATVEQMLLLAQAEALEWAAERHERTEHQSTSCYSTWAREMGAEAERLRKEALGEKISPKEPPLCAFCGHYEPAHDLSGECHFANCGCTGFTELKPNEPVDPDD